MVAIRREDPVDRENVIDISFGAKANQTNLRLVHPQVQQRIVQFAICAQRPVLVAELFNFLGRGRQTCFRATYFEIDIALVAMKLE